MSLKDLAFIKLGDFYYSINNKEQALEFYHKAYSNAKSFEVCTALYKYHLNEKEYEKALKYFKEIPPDCVYDAPNYMKLAELYTGMKKYKKALKCYKKELHYLDLNLKNTDKTTESYQYLSRLRDNVIRLIDDLNIKVDNN